MKKKILGYIRLQVPAGKATPSPPVGPALGQRGLNIMEFCKQFNEKTKGFEVGSPIPVLITAYVDKSFEFIIKASPTSFLIRKFAGLEKGSRIPGREVIGKIKAEEVLEIAKIKLSDMEVDCINAAVSMVEGTARSMGVVCKNK